MSLNKHYGRIFRLNRLINGITLINFFERIDKKLFKISAPSYLSRIERGRETIKIENISYLFSLLGLEFKPSKQEEINQFMENMFFQIYSSLIYSKNYVEILNNLEIRKKEIQTSLSYPKYLLIKLNIALNRNDKNYNYLFYFRELENCLNYLEKYQQQIFYDCMGYYYYLNGKYQEALIAYEHCDNGYYYNIVSGMINYQKALVLGKLSKIEEAIEYVNFAQNCFQSCLCYKRSYDCYFLLANLYLKNKAYKKAEKLYRFCYENVEIMANENYYQKINNYLCWVYLGSKRYDKLVEQALKMIETKQTKSDAYFMLSWFYYFNDNMELAKKYIKLALEVPSSELMLSLEQILAKIINGKASLKRIEEDLIKLMKKASLLNVDSNIYLFIYEVMIEFLHKTKQYEKEAVYCRELLNLYQKN